MQKQVTRLEASFEDVGVGKLSAAELLQPSTAEDGAETVQIKVGSSLVYEGVLSAGDVVSWRGFWANAQPGLRLWLNGTNLFGGPRTVLDFLTFSTARGKQRTILLREIEAHAEQVSLATASAETWRGSVLVWGAVMAGFSILVVFGIFGCAEPHAARGFTGIPARRFTLPVQTGLLVAWPIALGCVTVLAVYLAWSRLVLSPLLTEEVKMPDGYFALLLPTGLVIFQALVWGLVGFSKLRVFLITLLVLSLIPAAVVPFVAQGGEATGWAALYSKLFLALPALWLAGVVGAWLGVRQERRGGWASWQAWAAFTDFVHRWSPAPLGSGSALHAQLWFEWRRNARFALGVWTLIVACFVGGDLWRQLGPQEFRSAGEVMMSLGLVAVPAWVALAGLNLARDGSSRKLALSSFTATRPLSTSSLLLAKMLSGAALWVATLVVLLVAAMVWGVGMENGLRKLPPFPTALVALAVSLHVLVGILPFCLTGRIPGFPWSLLPPLLLYGLALNAVNWFGHRHEFRPLLLLLSTLVMVKLGLAFWGFRRAMAFRLISPVVVAGWVALWAVGTWVLVEMAWMQAARGNWAVDSMTFIPAALLALPLARIALSPLALAMNRHR